MARAPARSPPAPSPTGDPRPRRRRHEPAPCSAAPTEACRGFLSVGLLVAAATLVGSGHAAGGRLDPETGERTRPAPPPKVVHLTFDDGPSRPYTAQVLDLLARSRATATFFPIGSQLSANRALLRRMVREGHTIGNHTFSHADLTRLGVRELTSELDRMQQALLRATGTTTRLLRPPYGASDVFVRAVAAKHGYRIVLWDVDPQDWRSRSAAAIADHVLAAVRPGAVVLLHDGGGDRSATVAALERILATLTARGYVVRALGERHAGAAGPTTGPDAGQLSWGRS